MRKIWNRMIEKTNNLKLRRKLLLLYCGCVLLPLVLTDSIILGILWREERAKTYVEMKNIAGAVWYDLETMVSEAAATTNKIYINQHMNDFLEKRYKSGLDYYRTSYSFMKGTVTGLSSDSTNMIFYTDNDTVVNGGHFFRIECCRDEEWYRHLEESGQESVLCFYYAGDRQLSVTAQRKISFIKKLNYNKNSQVEKVVKYDMDYNTAVRKLVGMKYTMPIYVCHGDQIIFSNSSMSGYTNDFEYLTGKEDIGYEKSGNLYGESIRILVAKPESTFWRKLQEERFLIFFMLSLNILLPMLLVNLINESFTGRLQELSRAFDMVKAESLKEIENVRGTDEIGSLMHNYNRMVAKSQELIKTVYKDRLERQEIDIARQNAELLALHSQINPHFLFNVLESIRMHSLLKKEQETAGMIERLAVLARQNVDWSDDCVRIKDEMKFIGDYLELQKYRFGERLCYEMSINRDCEDYYLPKLTLVTFVENACVHGVENKAAVSFVYVRVYEKEGWLYLEVEDTGCGMSEGLVEELTEKLEDCTIETLKENKHIGVVNAFLRLKMITRGKVKFELESEEGVGTFMLLRIPVQELKGEKGDRLC